MTTRAEVDLRNREDAADVVSDTFTRMAQTLNKGVTLNNPRAWVWRVLRNRIIDEVRKRERRYRYCGEVLYWEPDMPVTDARQDLEIVVDEAHDIALALDALPPRQSTAVGLFYFEQRDLQEVGDRLAIKSTAAKTLLHRARANLRVEMELSHRA
jgi:RNA polymerase sigma factor (sigma-70 family)